MKRVLPNGAAGFIDRHTIGREIIGGVFGIHGEELFKTGQGSEKQFWPDMVGYK